jgi:hypothetical protein
MTVGIRHADHVAPYICKKLALTSPTSGGHSVGIVRLRTAATEFITSLVQDGFWKCSWVCMKHTNNGFSFDVLEWYHKDDDEFVDHIRRWYMQVSFVAMKPKSSQSIWQIYLYIYIDRFVIYIYINGCVCVFVCLGITLERLERFEKNIICFRRCMWKSRVRIYTGSST